MHLISKPRKQFDSFPGISFALKGVVTHAAELLKKMGYKLIWKGCQTDNYSTLGMTAICVTKKGLFTAAAVNFSLFSITIQFRHNQDGTWHIAHLQNWPKNGHFIVPVSSGAAPDVSGQPGPQIHKQQLALSGSVAAATDPPSMDLVGLNRPPVRNGGYVICLVWTRGDPKKFQIFRILANRGAWKIDCRIAPNTLLLRKKILLLIESVKTTSI